MAIAIDPVCGMEVDTESSQWTAEHNGEMYYFCSKGCMLDFKDEPEPFLDPGHTHTEMAPDSHS
jgi:YHS domain-containing protein